MNWKTGTTKRQPGSATLEYLPIVNLIPRSYWLTCFNMERIAIPPATKINEENSNIGLEKAGYFRGRDMACGYLNKVMKKG